MRVDVADENQPPEIERLHPAFTAFIEVAPGFWNYRADFKIAHGLLNLKTHMSVARLQSDDFVVIDAAELTPAAKTELDTLTSNGTKIVACVMTHPFHTVAIPALHALYPATETRRYLGCPRHLSQITTDATGSPIEWAGDLNEAEVCWLVSLVVGYNVGEHTMRVRLIRHVVSDLTQISICYGIIMSDYLCVNVPVRPHHRCATVSCPSWRCAFQQVRTFRCCWRGAIRCVHG
eukprot:SAG25_NODE_438_length_8018_cov_7.819800_9_plen_234_part_00